MEVIVLAEMSSIYRKGSWTLERQRREMKIIRLIIKEMEFFVNSLCSAKTNLTDLRAWAYLLYKSNEVISDTKVS